LDALIPLFGLKAATWQIHSCQLVLNSIENFLTFKDFGRLKCLLCHFDSSFAIFDFNSKFEDVVKPML
jgi:hypothetical protein